MLTTYSALEKYYGKFLSKRVENRKLITFWEGEDIIDDGEIMELTGGMPNACFFPLEKITMQVSPDPFAKNTAEIAVDHNSPKDMTMSYSFQYSETLGMKPLRDFVKQFVATTNAKVLYDEWDVLLAGGSSDALFKIFETLCDESVTVLVEEFTFTPVLSNVKATGASVLPIKIELSKDDERQGIDVDYLETILKDWEYSAVTKNLPRPRVLYTISTGQNPTGMTLPQWKRRKIYELAQRFDLIILEDDPYCFFTFNKFDINNPEYNPYLEETVSPKQFVEENVLDSLFSMDTDGRVVRIETYSKLFAPGIRLSYIVANSFFIDKLLQYTEITTKQPSGAAQLVVYSTVLAMADYYYPSSRKQHSTTELVDSWILWVSKLAAKYLQRRNVALKALYLTNAYKQNLFDVIEPSAGMFINIKLNFHHDRYNTIQLIDSLDNIMAKNGVKAIPGYLMSVDREFSLDKCDFFRITIAYSKTDEELKMGCERIAKAFEEFAQFL